MNRSTPIYGCMAAAILFFAISFSACKKTSKGKTTSTIMVNDQLAAAINFPAFSYWIYKDSVSGEIDSAYVADYSIGYDSTYGCNYLSTDTLQQQIGIIINVVCTDTATGVPPRSVHEVWTLTAERNTLYLALANNKDSIETLHYGLGVASFPLATGFVPGQYDHCLVPATADSANVSAIFPSYTVGGQSYSNTALSVHALRNINFYDSTITYNDSYYLTPATGFVKVVFNHPSESIHRVLELQRSKIVVIVE